jgi:hypothetical protein
MILKLLQVEDSGIIDEFPVCLHSSPLDTLLSMNTLDPTPQPFPSENPTPCDDIAIRKGT